MGNYEEADRDMLSSLEIDPFTIARFILTPSALNSPKVVTIATSVSSTVKSACSAIIATITSPISMGVDLFIVY